MVVTVHSDPISTKVIADGAGEWTFDIASLKKLPAGNHQVEVSALDTTTNKESAKNAVLSFKLLTAATTTKKKTVATTTSPKEDGSNPLVWVLVGLATVVFLTGLIWWLLRRKKAQPANNNLKPVAQDDIGASDTSDPISRNDTLETNDQTRPPMA